MPSNVRLSPNLIVNTNQYLKDICEPFPENTLYCQTTLNYWLEQRDYHYVSVALQPLHNM